MSPGYALLEESGPVLGAAARAVARVQPAKVNHHFWHELFDARALQRNCRRGLVRGPRISPFAGASQRADRGDADDCARSAAMELEQLGLLRAIAQAAGIEARARRYRRRRRARTAWQRQAVRYRRRTASRNGDGTARGSGSSAAACWWRAVRDSSIDAANARATARDMVYETRFDRLLQGESEQALFDALPQLLREAAAQGTRHVALGAPRSAIASISSRIS